MGRACLRELMPVPGDRPADAIIRLLFGRPTRRSDTALAVVPAGLGWHGQAWAVQLQNGMIVGWFAGARRVTPTSLLGARILGSVTVGLWT